MEHIYSKQEQFLCVLAQYKNNLIVADCYEKFNIIVYKVSVNYQIEELFFIMRRNKNEDLF